jgi:septal ring factor EnvC (AmiA/AmiB activator)
MNDWLIHAKEKKEDTRKKAETEVADLRSAIKKLTEENETLKKQLTETKEVQKVKPPEAENKDGEQVGQG